MTSARAMAMRWRWPPDKAAAALADDRVVALGQLEDEIVRAGELGGGDDALDRHAGSASAMLSRTVRLNSTFSCSTTPIWRRSQAMSTIARSTPSTSTRPLSGT